MHPLIVFGLSMYPDRQVHFAKPLFSIVHRVLGPQGDGSQGLLGSVQGESGGFPSYPGKQKHLTCPDITRQPELTPHRFSWH